MKLFANHEPSYVDEGTLVRKRKGTRHRFILENRRCTDDKIIQRPILYLRGFNGSQNESRFRLLKGYEDTDESSRQMALFAWDQDIPIHPADIQ